MPTYTEREIALMRLLREALAGWTPKQAFADSATYDRLYARTLPLDIIDGKAIPLLGASR